MTAEIVDLLQYRRQKARAENISRWAKTGGGLNQAGKPIRKRHPKRPRRRCPTRPSKAKTEAAAASRLEPA